MKINILGTEYELVESNEELDENLKGKDGYCDTSIKLCVVEEMNDEGAGFKKNLPEYKKAVKRHELIHAFLYESGLDTCSWAGNEEMVDWMALQFPKMMKAFIEAGCSGLESNIVNAGECVVPTDDMKNILDKYGRLKGGLIHLDESH